MSSIQTILANNTFGEWLVTINQVITENNSANSSVHPNVLVRRDSQGSFSANTLTANSISLVNTVNSITTDFFTNSHSSLATSKAVYDLLTGGSSKRLNLNVDSIEFSDGSSGSKIISDYNEPSTFDYNHPVTANAVMKMLEGTRHYSLPLSPRFNSFRVGSNLITIIEDDFSSINMAVDGSKTLVTAKAIENFLKTPSLDIHARTLQVNNTQLIKKIATDFAYIDDDTLATTKAINDYIGGVDNNIGTFEGQSLKIGTHTPVNQFTDDFTPIADTAVPTTLGVDFYLRGGLSDINANSIEANTTTSKDALVSNSAVLFGVAINAISTDLSVLNDSTLATTNAIVSFLSSGGAQSVSANTLSIGGFTINSIVSVIDSANLNSNTLATTQGIYDLISGGVASIPPLPFAANTLTFPGTSSNITIDAITNVLDAANSSANSLVTSEAVWDLLTNRTLNAKFNSLALFQGPTINWIHQSAIVYNQNSLMTSEAIVNYVQDSFNSTTQTLQVGTVEAAQAMGSPKVETELITTSTYGDNVKVAVGGTELKVNALGVFINGAAVQVA